MVLLKVRKRVKNDTKNPFHFNLFVFTYRVFAFCDSLAFSVMLCFVLFTSVEVALTVVSVFIFYFISSINVMWSGQSSLMMTWSSCFHPPLVSLIFFWSFISISITSANCTKETTCQNPNSDVCHIVLSNCLYHSSYLSLSHQDSEKSSPAFLGSTWFKCSYKKHQIISVHMDMSQTLFSVFGHIPVQM